MDTVSVRLWPPIGNKIFCITIINSDVWVLYESVSNMFDIRENRLSDNHNLLGCES